MFVWFAFVKQYTNEYTNTYLDYWYEDVNLLKFTNMYIKIEISDYAKQDK